METRSDVVIRRTYARPTNKEETSFESWDDICARVKGHQQWLWERAKGEPLSHTELEELSAFEQVMSEKKVSTSGRTLWLGGTDVSKKRESSQFNCSGTLVETVYDVVDVLWLLMQGCGVGFKPIVGTLNGFKHPIKNIEVIRTTRTEKGGCENNKESWDKETKTWTITVGDSAEAWSKSIGKLLAGKYPANTLVLNFSELRPAGGRLSGYGWISSGDEAISKAYVAIAGILNNKAGELLSRLDILDVVNWLGTILSSRRSAQIALFEFNKPEWEAFAIAKREFWDGNPQRSQSNNSLVFTSKPSKKELTSIFTLMEESGGSEPGFINGEAALNRAPWFSTVNPCAEILLGNKSFCNLVEIDISKFIGDTTGLHNTIYLAARANYRQTLVNLEDGVLQESWHLNNEFLRLCGVGLTGIAQRDDLSSYDLESMKRVAISAAYSMADELELQRPKNITTIKPSGTLSKVMQCPEGVHVPLGKYIFNNINFGLHDPLLPALTKAGYEVKPNPLDPEGMIVNFPVKWDHVPFTKVSKPDGSIVEVNQESAIGQLDRYKKYQIHWCQQNVSNTISYSPEEVPAIIDWLLVNWEHYVGVSFLYRADPTKTALDLGYPYLPQEVVSKGVYDSYVKKLQKFILPSADMMDQEMTADECASGACPIK
jgi:ribonucleoside-triphosphate reductase